MLDSDTYDVIVLGTGLAESIAAASLAKAGHSVLHLDPNEYYGGEQASLTLDELVSWAEARSGPAPNDESTYMASQRARYSSATTSGMGDLAADRRRYALSLFPSVMVSRGELVHTLISSDVSKYVGFRLLDNVCVWEPDGTDAAGGSFRRVPGSKEDVFKDKSISLPDKRRLMKALMFAGGEFEEDELLKGREDDPLYEFLTSTYALPARLAEAFTYAVAHAASPDEPARPALERARKYIRSIGRYGPSPFLVGQYGGAGEVAQGFCRACAVFGGTYVLGSEAVPSDITVHSSNVSITIPAHPTPLKAGHLICSPDFVSDQQRGETSTTKVSHAVLVTRSRPAFLSEEEGDDTAILVIPPADDRPFVRALVMGEGTGSCPAGQWVIYLWTEGSIDDLKEVGKLLPETAFEAYYVRQVTQPAVQPVDQSPLVVLRPYAGAHSLTEGLDWEASEGERVFHIISDRVFFEKSQEAEEEEEE